MTVIKNLGRHTPSAVEAAVSSVDYPQVAAAALAEFAWAPPPVVVDAPVT
jgi:hypothetical protein